MQKLIPALVKARLAFEPIAKDGKNPHYRTRYATLDSILSAVVKPLAENGLAIVQTLNPTPDAPILTTHLYHESGESIESNYPLPASTEPQKLGAAITYARRYAICAMLNIVADEDDDGNSASSKPTTVASPAKDDAKVTPISKPATAATDAPASDLISDAQRKRLYAIATKEGQFTKDGFKRLVLGFGFESSTAIAKDKYDEIVAIAGDPSQSEVYNAESADIASA